MADKALEILKQAILLEKRGQAFYKNAADQSGPESVKRFFEQMADEEIKHIEVLSEQFRSYQKQRIFIPTSDPNVNEDPFAASVITGDIQQKISAADFEAAAISAAMALETRAIQLYADRAESTRNPEEKALYEWLADWERSHLRVLEEIDRQLTEKIWYDNRFWPF